MKDRGYRLVTCSAVEQNENLEIIYHFDKYFKTENLRVSFPKNEPIQSITGIYSCAFLIENEIQDHFGVSFKDLSIDFQGHLYLDQLSDIRAPYCSIHINEENGGKK